PLLPSGVKSTQSHESLLTSPPGMHSIDLSAPNVEVKPLHSSVLGQGHFFHVATSQGSKYISCTTALERDKWLSSLRRTMRPQDAHSRRSDSSLKVWIVEAKNITPKRSYFCDILLDKTLYAKTSVKTMTDMLFWGEHFEFKNLPAVETITVNLYREADRKKKKDKNMLMGYITLTLADLENRQIIEKWITCQLGTVGKSGKDNKSELPIIRVKARKQTVDILPLDCYQSFLQHLTCDYKEICQIFEPLLAVREKEDFATCLVHVLQKQGKACEFLSDIILEEISRLDDEHLTFRGNSIATKAMEAYMKLVGAKYLQDTLGDLIQQLVQSPDDCEVDPTKVATTQLLNCHQKNLDMYSNMAWVKVINSYCYFPTELRNVFASLRSRCNERGKVDYSDNLISGCIFLRFLCPAILYPSLFNLTQGESIKYPNERASRNLTLIAKTIQTLANFTQFGIKEDYMTFMNSFVEKEAPNMKIFLHKISTQETSNQFLTFDGDIDLGKELSVLHALLLECTEKYSESDDTETRYGIPMSQAQTVQRQSSDSSGSSNDGGEEEPWQVMLVKTPSPLAASSPADRHSSIASLQKLTPLHSSSSDDSFNGHSASSIGSSSYFTCSSDFIHSASESFIFPPYPVQTSSSAAPFMNTEAIDGCSTFPRRRAQQLPPGNNTDNSAISQRDASSMSTKGTDKPAPLTLRGPAFYRQLSTPGQDSVQNSNQTSQFSPNKLWMKTKQAVQQKNVRVVKSYPGILSTAADSSNESHYKSIQSPSPLSSPGFTSGDYSPLGGSSATSSGYSSPQVHQRLDRGSLISSATNAATTGTRNIQGVAPKPPNLLTKSVGWQVAKQVERPSSLQETSSSGASSPQSPKFSAHNSMSSLHESSSAHSIGSPTTSSQSWSYTISQSDSNTSINSPTRIQQRPPAQSDSCGSLEALSASRTSQTSSSSVGSVSSGNNNLGSPCQTQSNNSHNQMNSMMPAFSTRLSSRSDTQINTSFLQTKPLPQPPAFLTSKYAVVRPHTANPTPNSRSERAASYHSSQEATKPRSRFPPGYSTSRSLDLGYLAKQTDETVFSADIKSIPDQHSDQISPTGSSSNRSLADGSLGSISNSPANSRLSPQSSVHMGINSVMRKLQEQEKTKQEYEQEVHVLRQQLLEAQERLQQTEIRLLDHEMETHKLMDEWQYRLVESEEKMKRQQAEKDEQMKAITIRLHSIEGELKKEHAEMVSAVEHKQQVIDVQEQRIKKLDQANRRLLQALADLKGRASTGVTDENSNSASDCNGEFENSEVAGFRTSSC
ncbi:unnamed protein product, partial [Candidula unifasciata]